MVAKKKIVYWKGGNVPNMACKIQKNLENGYSIKIAFGSDMKNIKNFLESQIDNSNYLTYKNSLSRNSYLTESGIRFDLFNMTSVYFLLLKEDIVCGIVIFDIPDSSSVTLVDFLVCEENLAETFLKESFGMLKTASVVELTKVRIYLSCKNSENHFTDLVKKIGFNKTALLKKEYRNQDLYMYDYLLQTEVTQ